MATSDVSGSSPIREGKKAVAVARRRSSRLYRDLIDGEVATEPAEWDVHIGDSAVRLLSIRYLGVLSPDSGQTILTDYLHRASQLSHRRSPPPSPDKGSTWPKKSKKKKSSLLSVSGSTSGKKRKSRGSSSTMENGNASGGVEAQDPGTPPLPATAGKMEGAPPSQPQDNGIPVDGVDYLHTTGAYLFFNLPSTYFNFKNNRKLSLFWHHTRMKYLNI